MSFLKLGELIEISRVENTESCIPAVSADILDNFKKFAANLKKVAPKAEDFLYFSAVMMHAAEAAGLNDDGTPKLNAHGQQVEVGWDKRNDTWRWKSNDPSITPYKNCFIPGTQVLMEDGTSKNIENIIPGDMVITHMGRPRKVLKTFITPHNGKLIELHIRNGRKIVTTDNHPFYRLSVTVPSNREDTPKHLFRDKNASKKLEFIEAGALSKYDILTSPILGEQRGSELNANQAKLLGYFAAEGCYSKKYNKYQGVRFTLNLNEIDTLAPEIKRLALSVFPNCSVNIHNESGNTSCVYITGSGVVDFFKNHVGEYSEYKSLSRDLVFGSAEVKENFIIGWLEGDGHCEKNNGQLIGVTTSNNMASQIRVMLNSIGVNNSLRFVPTQGSRIINKNYDAANTKDSYRIEICATAADKLIKNSNKLNFTNRGEFKVQNSFHNNYALYTLGDIIDIDYTGDLFNFEVEEDNSYVVNDIIVHNCNGDIFPEEELVKAYKKWVGKPLCIDHKSSSVDHVRGFIVDTYYDRNLKRVIALCALDKAGYPQLARQVSTGVSSCVSMGTAVGRAICSDCATVARTEQDFCDHMRKKSCYGEINVDLSPIELSIVVNGADPKANIKHIIAAANTLNSYVESKLVKLADKCFSATLTMDDKADGDSTVFTVNASDLENFKAELDAAYEKLKDINIEISIKDTNDLASNQSSGTVAMDETMVPNTDSGLAPPSVRYASYNNSIAELHKVTATIEDKLKLMKESLDKLSNSYIILQTKTQEENMSGSKQISKEGYYHGTEEPTPGQAKYQKDPLNEQLRAKEDKQMVGQTPFPGVGSVDGVHPSPGSVDPSNELERKKMLARAEAEERAMRRNAIVNLAKSALQEKKGYFQGGGGVNEPTPGKTKYPADGLQEGLREDSDKQMVGQKPFPGVGSVSGLHPSPSSADTADELARKKLLNRASLRARFIKAANSDGSHNLSNSAWEVYLGEKLLLTASVSELSGGRSEMLYDSIATKEFGSRLIEKVKVHGAVKANALVKRGQDVAPAAPLKAPPVDAALPVDAPVDAPVDVAPPAEASNGAEDTGGTGDPQEAALELAEKVRDTSSDLVEAVRALTGEQVEMGEVALAPDMGATASDQTFNTANMNSFRKELNSELTHAMKEAIATLNDHQQELEMIAGMYEKGAVSKSNSEFVGSIVEDALNEAKSALADSFKLMTAFVKYARGTKAIVKRAEIEAELMALAEGDTMSTEFDSHSDSDLMSLINETNDDLGEVKDMLAEDEDQVNGLDSLDGLESDDLLADDADADADAADANDVDVDDVDANDLKVTPAEVADLPDNLKPGTNVQVTAGFDSKAGRAAMRAKLAADALGTTDMSKQKFSDMLGAANSLANGQTKLDVMPSNNLGKVETLPELNKAMLDLAKAPPKVRKEAEVIHKLVSEGTLDPNDLDALVAEGLDKDAVSYYKKFYGQVDGGNEFASELVKEHVKAEMEKELNTFKVKMARAYELTYDMVDRGLVTNDRQVISSHVDELMGFNEANFDTLKKVVARHAPAMRKEAGRMPQVGMFGSGEVNTVNNVEDDWNQLSAAFSKTTKRLF